MPGNRPRSGATPNPLMTIVILMLLVGLGGFILHGSGAIRTLNAAGVLGQPR
jgi:hypothetical protein